MPGPPPIADLHQDLWSHVEAREVFGEEMQTSPELLATSPIRLVVASTFNMHEGARVISEANAEYSLELMAAYANLCRKQGWTQVLAVEDLAGDPSTEVKLVVHVEGINAFSAEIEDELALWWERGCRSVGPMWNLDNGIGGGPHEPEKPLSEVGRRAVRWIDSAPMVLDVAHMGEETFWATLEETSGTVIASHANARALNDHPRNLRDDQIRALAERGGVVGIVLSKRFLGLSQDLEAVFQHAEHIIDLVGAGHLAIGTDLGGLRDLIDEVATVEHISEMASAFEERFGSETWTAVAWDNPLRCLRESLAKPSPTPV